MIRWLLLMDLDGTLWDHPDVSLTTPPFAKVGELSIRDVDGETITAFNDAIEFVRWARGHGAIVSSLSWNREDMATDAIKALGLCKLFDYLAISPEPNKAELLRGLILRLTRNGITVPSERFVYIDDRDIHVDEILKLFPNITFIHMWKDVTSFAEVKRIIRSKLGDMSDDLHK
jgi:magnesium-dependent phosphatase-1